MTKTTTSNGATATLTKGNLKLDKSILIWSIPAIQTCPNCQDCAKHCYARKAEKVYPAVLPCRNANWQAAESEDFVQAMVRLIKTTQKNAKKYTPKAVRIHESGDFYSKAYAEKWAQIARQCPDLVFYGYTKAVENLPENLPNNMNIVHSLLDGNVNFGSWEYVKALAKEHHAAICPYGLTKHHFTCGTDCQACLKKDKIVFLQH